MIETRSKTMFIYLRPRVYAREKPISEESGMGSYTGALFCATSKSSSQQVGENTVKDRYVRSEQPVPEMNTV
jgi:hypothetical protein